MFRFSIGLVVMLSVCLLVLTGCGRDEPRVYRVAKDEVPDAPPPALSWMVPPTWQEGPTREMLLAVFAVPGGAEMTVSAIGGDGGGALANVNRWRGQLALAPIDAAALAAAVETVETPAGPASVIRLDGGEASTMAAWLEHGGQTWFLKLNGPVASVDAQADNFTRVVASLRSAATEPAAP